MLKRYAPCEALPQAMRHGEGKPRALVAYAVPPEQRGTGNCAALGGEAMRASQLGMVFTGS